MSNRLTNLINHYQKLWFFAFNRFEGNNYQLMSDYFTQRLIMEVEEYLPLWQKKVLDVGGAEGEFCRILSEQRKCHAINLDPYPALDRYTDSTKNWVWPDTEIGFADIMPFENNVFDVVICRGVLEHIPLEKQQPSINEMHRVIKAGEVCYIMIPPWYNPHAGHDLKPFHIFPFRVAKFLRQLFFRYKISINEASYAEWGLYPITFRKMLDMISRSNFKIVAMKDTHLGLHFLTRIPVIREIAIPSVAFLLTKE